MNRAGYQTVDFVLFQHQGAENHVVFQLLTRDRFGHAFVLTQFDQATHIAFANHFRIDDFNAGAKLHALGRGYAVDLIRVTQRDAGGDPRSAQIAAAFTVRGSSPSGRTTRLPALRASSVSW